MTNEHRSPIEDIDRTADLLARARAGEETALDELFERHIPLLKRWASGRLPRWARQAVDTSDLIQETLIATLRNLRSFEPRGNGALQAYLRQTLINRVRNEMRRALLRASPAESDSQHPHDGACPLEVALGARTLERYEAALARLTEEEPEAVVTRVEFGFSYREGFLFSVWKLQWTPYTIGGMFHRLRITQTGLSLISLLVLSGFSKVVRFSTQASSLYSKKSMGPPR